MNRREFITLLGGAATWPFAGWAQTPVKRVIGHLAAASFTSAAPQAQAIEAGLQELGYLEGRDYEMVRKSAEGVAERLPVLAAEMVRLKPDVIVANPTPAVVAVRTLTTTIPIVSFMLADEVRLGLVANSARPGGNVTGLLMRVDGMVGKQVELATEIVSGAKKLGILLNPGSADAANQRRESEAASTALGVTYVYAERDVHQADRERMVVPAASGFRAASDFAAPATVTAAPIYTGNADPANRRSNRLSYA